MILLPKYADIIMKVAPLLAFMLPSVWLYVLYPASFESMWKGRTFQVIFIWLVALELILDWETFQTSVKLQKGFFIRFITLNLSLAGPTVYVLASVYAGLSGFIVAFSKSLGVTWAESMPLAFEYFVYAAFFCLIIFLEFGNEELKKFSVPATFLCVVGILYFIDNVCPYGRFTPFQVLVLPTVFLASRVLQVYGYTVNAVIRNEQATGYLPLITATDPGTSKSATFAVAWPCAGVESMLIYSVILLLFLKRMTRTVKHKAAYFTFGAAVTYMLNIFRIVTIFRLGIAQDETSEAVQTFHFFYGPLYSVIWIILYLIVILSIQSRRNETLR